MKFARNSINLKPALGGVLGVALVLVVSGVAFAFHLNFAATGFIHLFVVLLVALRLGFLQATAASIVANCCLNYFFAPPIFQFTIADPENWVALLIFELSALVVSRLSAEANKQTVQARNHEAELQRLYDLSQRLLLSTGEGAPAPQLLALIQQTFSTEAAVLFDGVEAVTASLGETTEEFESGTKAAYLRDRDFQSADGRTWIRVLRQGVRAVGALGIRADGLTAASTNALASVTALALERARSLAKENRAEAERQTEQLRTVVLDALAHEYKTPLAVIRTATTGLMDTEQLAPMQLELLCLVDSEVTRLSDLTTRLLQMSRLDRADIHIRLETIDLDELIETVIASAKRVLGRHSVQVQSGERGLSIRADRELISTALAQFLDNAAKYSDPASTITVAITPVDNEIQMSVHNPGPLIRYEDRELIFKRFYRSSGSSHKVSGTGIGLSISKKVADAHSGRVWVMSEAGSGNTFVLALPRTPQ